MAKVLTVGSGAATTAYWRHGATVTIVAKTLASMERYQRVLLAITRIASLFIVANAFMAMTVSIGDNGGRVHYGNQLLVTTSVECTIVGK